MNGLAKPTLEIRIVESEQITAIHDSSMEYGEESFSVDTGITGAVCTLWDVNEVIAENVSGLDNVAVLEPGDYGFLEELVLTVFYTQSIPYISDILFLTSNSS